MPRVAHRYTIPLGEIRTVRATRLVLRCYRGRSWTWRVNSWVIISPDRGQTQTLLKTHHPPSKEGQLLSSKEGAVDGHELQCCALSYPVRFDVCCWMNRWTHSQEQLLLPPHICELIDTKTGQRVVKNFTRWFTPIFSHTTFHFSQPWQQESEIKIRVRSKQF